MSSARTPRPRLRLVATGSRLVVGLLVAGGLVAGTVAAIPLTLPGVHTEPARTVVTPDAGESVLVCAGPFRALGRDGSDALQMQAAGTPAITTGTDGAEPVRGEVSAADIVGDSAVAVFTSEGGALVSAAQSLTLRDPDLSGLAAAACRPTQMQAWLVGGTASVGAADVVTIANPSEIASTVTITTYGDAEPSERTAIVPARTQIAYPLASAAVGQSSLVVHIAADGAAVRAALQSSLVRTLDPGGIDLQDDAGGPAFTHVLAGVQVNRLDADEVTTRVRLLAPDADSEAEITVRAVGSDRDAIEPLRVPLTAGTPLDVGFPGLASGTYRIDVTASEPVVAAAWQTNGFHPGSDFAWMTPAPVLEGSTLLTVPASATARLHVLDAAGAQGDVVLTDLASGDTLTITVDAGGAALTPLRSGTTYLVESSTLFRAAVALSGRDALAGFPLWPEASRPVSVTVYP